MGKETRVPQWTMTVNVSLGRSFGQEPDPNALWQRKGTIYLFIYFRDKVSRGLGELETSDVAQNDLKLHLYAFTS